VVIWYISPRFGTLDQEKSGNPGWKQVDAKRARFISPIIRRISWAMTRQFWEKLTIIKWIRSSTRNCTRVGHRVTGLGEFQGEFQGEKEFVKKSNKM
jgi:hypothetical protein